MRKPLTFVILLLLFSSCSEDGNPVESSQESGCRLVSDTLFEQADPFGEHGPRMTLSSYSYDSKGQLSEFTQNLIPVPSSRPVIIERFVYNNGLVEAKEWYNDGREVGANTYGYENGLLISARLSKAILMIYEYDSRRNMVKRIVRQDSGATAKYMMTRYSDHHDGRPGLEERYGWSNTPEGGKLVSRMKSVYVNGNRTDMQYWDTTAQRWYLVRRSFFDESRSAFHPGWNDPMLAVEAGKDRNAVLRIESYEGTCDSSLHGDQLSMIQTYHYAYNVHGFPESLEIRKEFPCPDKQKYNAVTRRKFVYSGCK